MIKVISAISPPSLVTLKPGDTTETLNQRMCQEAGTAFQIALQETITGRFLPRDEEIFDNREYHVTFTRLPRE